jgi:hypothetical protein
MAVKGRRFAAGCEKGLCRRVVKAKVQKVQRVQRVQRVVVSPTAMKLYIAACGRKTFTTAPAARGNAIE